MHTSRQEYKLSADNLSLTIETVNTVYVNELLLLVIKHNAHYLPFKNIMYSEADDKSEIKSTCVKTVCFL